MAAASVMGHEFGCRSAAGLACNCPTSRVVSAVAAALGVEPLAAGHVRLVLDLRLVDAEEILQDVRRLDDAEVADVRNGRGRGERPWQAAARQAAASATANPMTTHHFSHAPEPLCALRVWAHEYSTKQAAEVLGCTVQNVRWLCWHKVVPARQVPSGRRSWVLDAEAVHAYAAVRGGSPGVISSPGRPTVSGR